MTRTEMERFLKQQFWFLSQQELAWCAANLPTLAVVVRRGMGRDMVRARDAAAHIDSVKSPDYVRDVFTRPDWWAAVPRTPVPKIDGTYQPQSGTPCDWGDE